MDILADDLIIVELKSGKDIEPIWEAQLISHLKLAGLHTGFFINFFVVLIRDGIRRFSQA